ncbi:MAG: hypothetical protein NNA20_05870 [Nitrospira sp.]|nr:hypothetical protein [Nitrospira sp.]MCP9442102.1 hypothetical protein [Nitrospira sp.]
MASSIEWWLTVTLAFISLSITAVADTFLFFNGFHPARLFWGDTGSNDAGCFVAGLGLNGLEQRGLASGSTCADLCPFIVDASVTLTRRLLKREKIRQAHRSHFYQRLVLAGWEHRKTAYVEYGLMSICGLGSLIV